MSIHPSLKTKSGALAQHRNVLTRTERIAKLSAEERFNTESSTALGLIKVRSIKVAAGKKKTTAEGEAAADPKAAGGKAPAAKAASPAAKAAAPAAKKK